MKHLVIVCFLFLLFSCEKKELPVKPYDRGDVLTTQVEMGQDYKKQVWFSLYNNSIVASNLKTDWDLAFEAAADGHHILLNGAKGMRAYKTGYSTLEEVKDTAGLGSNGKADRPSGNLDSTAIDDWQNNNTVYIINNGYSETGQQMGYYKLKIKALAQDRYSIDYAALPSGETVSSTVTKNAIYNFMAFSFSAKSEVNIEPPKAQYDLCFTQYTHVFLDPFQYYQVTGILTNSPQTRVARLSNKTFDAITINDTTNAVFMIRRDAIGYDWKTFDLNSNLYTVNTKQMYLICDGKGFYYKFHFIDFYNTSGIKGYPKFEFKKL